MWNPLNPLSITFKLRYLCRNDWAQNRTGYPMNRDDTVNVARFGARGDGKTDDTAAIRGAIAALPERGQDGALL